MENINDILARIDKFAEMRDTDKILRENALKEKADMIVKFVNEYYGHRIDNIVKVANRLWQKGIYFNSTRYCHNFHDYRENVFLSDGFYHQLGLYMVGINSDRVFNGLRIAMGGACGNRTMIFNAYDVYVDIDEYGKHKTDVPRTSGDIENMTEFIDKFDAFETAFYKWVEKITTVDGFISVAPTNTTIETKEFIIKVEKK